MVIIVEVHNQVIVFERAANQIDKVILSSLYGSRKFEQHMKYALNHFKFSSKYIDALYEHKKYSRNDITMTEIITFCIENMIYYYKKDKIKFYSFFNELNSDNFYLFIENHMTLLINVTKSFQVGSFDYNRLPLNLAVYLLHMSLAALTEM